jgi:hypothetical protein
VFSLSRVSSAFLLWLCFFCGGRFFHILAASGPAGGAAAAVRLRGHFHFALTRRCGCVDTPRTEE